MKLYEIRQNIQDTSITRDILDISRISKRLALFIEFIDNGVATYDYEYLTVTSNKVKLMLAVAEQIVQSYVTENTKGKKQKDNVEFVIDKG